jgi:hypothetical protein
LFKKTKILRKVWLRGWRTCCKICKLLNNLRKYLENFCCIIRRIRCILRTIGEKMRKGRSIYDLSNIWFDTTLTRYRISIQAKTAYRRTSLSRCLRYLSSTRAAARPPSPG